MGINYIFGDVFGSWSVVVLVVVAAVVFPVVRGGCAELRKHDLRLGGNEWEGERGGKGKEEPAPRLSLAGLWQNVCYLINFEEQPKSRLADISQNEHLGHEAYSQRDRPAHFLFYSLILLLKRAPTRSSDARQLVTYWGKVMVAWRGRRPRKAARPRPRRLGRMPN